MPVTTVDLGKRSYPIQVGTNCVAKLTAAIGRSCRTDRLFVFYDANLFALHGAEIRKALKLRGRDVQELVVPSGEKAKSPGILKKIYGFLLDLKISRDDFILVCGGGVTSDLVGYAAATTLRGIRWGVVPTTLLAMVDAAIGGKTGINHKTGKNLIGVFHQPAFVHCDTRYLHTLPPREFVAGLGEVAKYGGLIGPDMIALTQKYLSGTNPHADRPLVRLIHASAAYKAEIVSRDEREGSLRMRLNLGHTFGHAIERATGYGRLRHGEAVVLGLLAAIELSSLVNPDVSKRLQDYREMVVSLIRQVKRVEIDEKAVLDAISLDKKRSAAQLKFVLLKGTGKPYFADNISMSQMRKSLRAMLACYKVHGGTDAPYSGRKRA
ncbi:MAG: 3-dehydroquinate synthase [candidate division Zixibacteria bacterium]|nr:3-dehydroquinate synthase [candidate division Zixibacteria bacterium]